MYAIAGVTGHTGTAVAEALLAQKQPLRVIVRSEEKGAAWKKRGAEVAVAELGNAAQLAAALKGVKGAYLLCPPNFAAADYLKDRKLLMEGMTEGLKQARVTNVVFLSSGGAQNPEGTGPVVALHRAEKMLRGIAPSVTFVRAAYFLENWASSLPTMKEKGILPHFGPVDMKFPQVCSADIGAAVAGALLSPADGTQVLELAGPEDFSVQDVAKVFSELLGKPLQAVAAPVEGAFEGLKQAGVPDEMARLYAQMYQAMGKGLLAWEFPGKITRGRTGLKAALQPLVR